MTASKLDSPIPGIRLKFSEFPETFILETEDAIEIEEDFSDNESYIVESEGEDSSEFWSDSEYEDETQNEEHAREKLKKGRPFKPLDDLGNFDCGVFKKVSKVVFQIF